MGTGTVKAVLTGWLENFVVDVPAKHIEGEYLIPLAELEKYIYNLEYGDLVDIMTEVEDNYL